MEGFKETIIEGQRARVAELEKALLDFLHFRRDGFTVDLLLEKLNDAKKKLMFPKLLSWQGYIP